MCNYIIFVISLPALLETARINSITQATLNEWNFLEECRAVMQLKTQLVDFAPPIKHSHSDGIFIQLDNKFHCFDDLGQQAGW